MSKNFLADLAERAIATYIQVLIGLLIVSGVTDFTAVKAAAIAAIPAALSVVKSVIADHYKPEDTVSPASFALKR